MKFLSKYSIFALFTAAIAALTGCEEQEADHYLSEIKVSTSYVSLPAEGGEAVVTLKAEDDWEFDKVYVVDTGEKDENGKAITEKAIAPKWLTITPASGSAGETSVKFSAEAATETCEASVVIKCAGKTQTINVIQMTEKVEPPTLTVSEALEIIKPLGDQQVAPGTYRVRGKVCKISEISTQYGNATYFLSDDGTYQGKSKTDCNWLQVYRGLWLNGASFKDGDEFAVGDELVIEGLLMDYKGTPETKEKTAFVVSITKSLIDVEAFDFDKLPAIDTTFTLKVKASVSPLLVSSDSDWLQLTGVNAEGAYTLHADANDYTAERTATISIQGPGALKTVSVTQVGVPPSGASVTEIIAMEDGSEIETLESTVIAKTTKGVVISDGASAIYVYGTLVDALAPGNNVKIIGQKTSYNGVPEIVFKADNAAHGVTVYSAGNTFEVPAAKDITAEAGTYTASQAEYVKLTGTLTVSGNYYNLLLDEFPDGSKQGSIVYPVEDLAAASFDGKKITVTGWFNGLSSAGKYINIIATKIVEFVDNPKGTATNPYLPSEIAAEIIAGNVPEEDVYIKGIVSAVLYTASANYPTATFWISDDGTAYGISEDKKSSTEKAKDFECYSVNWFDNQPWAEGEGQVGVGDEVIVCGKTTSYNGQPETSSKKAWLYSVNYVKTAGVGLGSTEFPFNIAGVEEVIDYQQAEIAAAKAAEAPAPVFKDVCVKGKVSAVQSEFGADYGNGTFWISDDGVAYGIADDKKSTTEPAKDFECYRVLWFNNEKWTDGCPQVAVGDDVVVIGQMTLYAAKGIYETQQNNAWVYSVNGATE